LESQQKEGGLDEGQRKSKGEERGEGVIKEKKSPKEDPGIRHGINKPVVSQMRKP
jgi:hypothetical protein